MKIAFIGAGSICFCPATVMDILQNEAISGTDLTVALMDINKGALDISSGLCQKIKEITKRLANIFPTLSLEEALKDADYVLTAIEVDRYLYWSQDFLVPKKYGFRQIYGENGGPGSMFHTLRNLPPLLHIAKTMERLCPNAYLLNYTNPEAKLIEMIRKETSIKAVGLCHGEAVGKEQLSILLDIPKEDLVTEVNGINHFGWFTKIEDKNGNDLYPLLKQKDLEKDWDIHWDWLALARVMMRTYGLWSYPGTSHCGEFIAWSDSFMGNIDKQYFTDPATEKFWGSGRDPKAKYAYAYNKIMPLAGGKAKEMEEEMYRNAFDIHEGKLWTSGEYGVPIIEAIHFNKPTLIGALNTPNTGFAKGLKMGMVVEVPAMVDGKGIHPIETTPLPTAINSMIYTQGTIHELVYEAYKEKSRRKLLQAVLLDPTISTYNNAVAMIDEMCELQKELLPELNW